MPVQVMGMHRGRSGWGRRIWAAALLMLLLATPGGARAAGIASVGLRYGWSHADGDLFTGSGDLDSGDLLGLHLDLELLPFLGIEVAGEYVSEDLAFDTTLYDSLRAQGDADYEDLTLYVTGRLNLFSFALLPLKGYLGGGLNVHYAEVELSAEEVAQGAQPARAPRAAGGWGDETTDALEDFVARETGARTRIGWHLVGGVRFTPPGLPLSAFLEGRYGDPFEADLPSAKSLYAGVSFRL